MSERRDLEATRPVDVTGDGDPLETAVEVKASPTGAAMEMFGKPYGSLTRSQQVIIDDILRGRRMEIEENLRAMQLNTALTVHQRIERGQKAMDEVARLRDMLIADAGELMSNDDLSVSEVPEEQGGLKKTRAGTIRRNLRHAKVLMGVLKTHTEIEVMLAKLGEQKAAATFVKNDNRVVAQVTPESIGERLGRFGKGGAGADSDGTQLLDAGEQD